MPVDQDSVRARPGVRDVWQIVGQRVEIEDRLRTQRTWFTRALSGGARLILLDEPFTGIDPKTIGDIQEIVRSLLRQGWGSRTPMPVVAGLDGETCGPDGC